MSKHADQLDGATQPGVIVIWVDRPLFGRYGYVAPYQRDVSQAIMYFDEKSLIEPGEPVAEGSLVHYQIEEGVAGDRWRAVNIEVERFISPVPQLDFVEWDVMEFPILNSSDPVGKFLLAGLTPELVSLLDTYHKGDRVETPPALIQFLNALVDGSSLFEKERFAHVKLRRLTQLLLAKKPKGRELKWLNRLLLEDAYPESFTPKPLNVDCSPRLYQASVVHRDHHRRIGSLELSNGETVRFSFNDFPTDDLVPHTGDTVQCRIYNESEPFDIWKNSPQLMVAGAKPGTVNLGKAGGTASGFRYDVDTGDFILPNGITIKFSPRYAQVFTLMLRKISNQSHARVTKLEYRSVAKMFERGILREAHPNADERELNLKLRDTVRRIDEDPGFAKERAQEFRRQFAKMLKRKVLGISVKDVLRVSKGGYSLGPGWDKTKMVTGGSEVSLVSQRQRDDG